MASLDKAADWTDPQNLLAALGSYPEVAQAAAWVAGQQQVIPSTDIVVTIYDKFYNAIGEINDYISLEALFARNETGTATIVMKSGDPNTTLCMNCVNTVVPMTIQVGFG